MQTVKLDVKKLDVESFGLELEDVVAAVLAGAAPTARTRECPCIELTSPAVCG